VQVISRGNQLEVKVPDQAPLSTVMVSVCQQQRIKCSGTETLGSYRGPAMSVEGTLRQVISKLLEGTDVNYEFSRTADGGATAIAFLGHAPKGTAAAPTSQPPQPEHPPLLHSRPYPGKPPDGAGPPQSELRPEAPGDEGNLSAEDGNATVQSQQAAQAASMLATGTGNKVPAQSLPFPDAQGQPMPVNNTTPTSQPFPDQFGNPVPVKPSPGGSPFPTKGSGSQSNNSHQ
jgi:hypothetical protein